jgi:polysaccharide biosynthesis/export protein
VAFKYLYPGFTRHLSTRTRQRLLALFLSLKEIIAIHLLAPECHKELVFHIDSPENRRRIKATHMKAFSVLVIALTTLVLHACAIVPGQHMSVDALTHGGSPESGHVQLVQITPEWLAENQATASTQMIAPELLSYRPEPYRIGAGDTLYITVWDHPELTSPAGSQQQTLANGRLVRSDGTLFYPYVGTIKAADMTIEELRKQITKMLGTYIQKPQVDVSVIGYASQLITLQGAFTKTDPQPVTAVPLTLAQAIGSANINTEQADLSDLILTRDGRDYHVDLNMLHNARISTQNIYLKPGDRLFLSYNDNKEVYVMGEVIRPLAITFKTGDLSLTQALGRTGGLDPITSDGKAVYVIRGAKDLAKGPATVFHLNAHSPAAFVLADNFRVRPGDVVFVGPAGVTEWGRVLSQIVPLSGILGNAAFAREQISATP